jgi:CRISPR-associated protein Cmr1
MMKALRYELRFLTPAFLGDAEQSGRWRTPPFKAQLRQWWRVAYAADRNFRVDVEQMRREEGVLFGNAWLEDEFSKSLVRLRLDRWGEGGLKKASWPADIPVTHPEVKNRDGRAVPVGSALYQGFGPLVYDSQRRTTTLKATAAIQADESATLSLASPEEHAVRIERALWLMDQYGTLGGRSRNGWGSYRLSPAGNTPALTGAPPLRSWRECLQLDWPHAIGQDDRGSLIWQTSPHDDWKSVMKALAVVKIGLRTQFRFPNERPDGRIHERHWLSYPVTKHQVNDWNWSGLRLPNTLRFKARPTTDGKLVGVIFHVPHLPPPAFKPDRKVIEDVWARVHAKLDATPGLARSKE